MKICISFDEIYSQIIESDLIEKSDSIIFSNYNYLIQKPIEFNEYYLTNDIYSIETRKDEI